MRSCSTRGRWRRWATGSTLREIRQGESGAVGVVATLVDPPAPVNTSSTAWPDLPEEIARQWLLPPVWERMVAGRGEFLADLRPAVPIFVRFGGLDFERDPRGSARAGRLRDGSAARPRRPGRLGPAADDRGQGGLPVRRVRRAGRARGRRRARLRGRPAAARARPTQVPVTDVQIGVASGQLRSGTYGHFQRRTFCCLGDAVNLAARLMSRAPAGGGLGAARTWWSASGARFEWDDLAPITVKGTRAAGAGARVDRSCGTTSPGCRHGLPERAWSGATRSSAGSAELWRAADAGRGQVVVVQAEAGTGKIRLVAELVGELVDGGRHRRQRRGDPPSPPRRRTPAWRDVWTDLLGLDPDQRRTRTRSPRRWPGSTHDSSARAPLLGPVLGLALPDSDLTASFDGRAAQDLAGGPAGAGCSPRGPASGPVVVVIEDAHWLDPLSRDLLDVLARTTAFARVLLVVTSRPDGTPVAGLPGPARGPRHRPGAGVAGCRGLGRPGRGAAPGPGRPGRRDPSSSPRSWVGPRATPSTSSSSSTTSSPTPPAPTGRSHPDALELPSSLHSLVLSRIDAQPEGPRRAVKVASVIGRAFRSPLVAAAYPDLGPEPVVHGDLVAWPAPG